MTPRVLLAEDDADHAFLTTRAFRDVHGEEVELHTVTDGQQALDFLQRRGEFADVARPHLIVLDLKMARLSGLELLAALESDEELRSIPTVVLSSSTRAEDVAQSYALNANSYVTKPATLSGLREGVQQMARYWIDVATLPTED